VNLALARSPRVREIEARLGLGRAELEAARRIGNPTFGYSELSARDGGGKQITRSVTLGLTDLLMLGARKRVAAGELDREGQLAADELLQFAADVEVAWYEAVAGARLAAVRETIAQSAANSADLAQALSRGR
jgi:outer membrane protein TolC